jgi:hypothetical protein
MKSLRPLLTVLLLLNIGFRMNGAEQPAGAKAASPAESQKPKVDINTAEIPELEAIPEIGTNFANAVVGARPFRSVDDLDRILKIGPEGMKSLKEKVTASPAKPPTTPPPRTTPDNLGKGATKPTAINDGKAVDRKEVNERHDAAERRGAEKSERRQ